METADDVGLCRALGARNVAIVDGIRLRDSVPAKASKTPVCVVVVEKQFDVERLNAHSEEKRRLDTTQRRSSSFECGRFAPCSERPTRQVTLLSCAE